MCQRACVPTIPEEKDKLDDMNQVRSGSLCSIFKAKLHRQTGSTINASGETLSFLKSLQVFAYELHYSDDLIHSLATENTGNILIQEHIYSVLLDHEVQARM